VKCEAKDPFIVCAALGFVLMCLFGAGTLYERQVKVGPAATKITSLPRNNYDDFVRLAKRSCIMRSAKSRSIGNSADRRLLHLLFQRRCQIPDD
jgi:hypothetical protein